MADKTRLQTYNFLIENKSIEDILNQPNTTFKEKRRHGGVTYKLIEINNINNQSVNDDLSENEIFYDTYDTVDDLNNIPINETLQSQSKIHEQEKEIQQLKKENEELKQLKQNNMNLTKYTYNAVTIYNEKQRTNTGIEKIHEEILLINNEIYFITTFVHINQSISEKILCFQQFKNGEIKIFKQNNNYQNISEYQNNLLIINNNTNINVILIKDFLKKQQNFKLKPTKIERTLWCIFTAIAILAGISTFIGVIILFFPTIAVIPAVAIWLKVVGTLSSISFIRIFASLFSSATRKVDVWFGNKLYKNKEQKEKQKKERQSIIKNLTNDKLETKLQTQYDILKQELDNRKEKIPDKLISNNKINHNSNNISQNLDIKSENQNNFDSSIRNIINNQNAQTSTTSNHNWNKVKCLLTT